jgi:hypothetical protein
MGGLNRSALPILAAGALLAACAQTPMGPTVQVMPGAGKSFDAFQQDQAVCKAFATDQVRGQSEDANQRAVGTAAIGTLLGAGLGAAAGAIGGNAGAGAALGAGVGVAGGSALGASNSQQAQVGIQVQYNNAFSQCMYTKGNQVPGYYPPPVSSASPPPLAVGPDPALVRSVQSELIRLGYMGGGADGALGPQTRSAIRDYEHAVGLPPDGTVSPRLLAALQSTPTSSASAVPAAAPAAPQ